MRPLAQAICAFVRGFHVGAMLGPRMEVTLRRLPPLASATHISESPERDDENAIFVPSPDHAGDWLLPPAVPAGKLTSRPSSKEYIRMSHPLCPREAKAIRELSGEMRGESEIVPRCVTAC